MWPAEIHPDHDYYIWLTEDFHEGTVGRPWEPSDTSVNDPRRADAASARHEIAARTDPKGGHST
jgi:Protein of unknown function (DUF2716)